MAGRWETHRSDRAAGSGPDDSAPVPAGRLLSLDPVQERLIELLREAGDRPVPYRELEAAGIEYPAAALYELEAAGIGVDRVHSGPERRLVGVRLDPAARAAVVAAAEEAAPAARRLPKPRGPRLPGTTWALVAALVVGFAAGVALMALAGGGGGGRGDERGTSAGRSPTARSPAASSKSTRTAHRPRPSASPARPPRRPARPPRPPARPPRPHVAVSSADAARWEAQGHSLLGAGRYAAAIPALRRALAATGQTADRCLQPTTEVCLTYAYALYDLGHALRLSGRPGAAADILQRRLRIDNQRDIVRAELALARAQARS